MRSSFAVCALAVALCLFVCVSSTKKVNEGEATTVVEEAQRTVKTVHGTAQTQFNNAKGLLVKVQLSKRDSQEAASKSHAAATDNEEAKKIATKIQSLSDEVAASYSEVKEKLEEAVKSLTPLLAEAQTLEGKPDIEITANGDQGDDYTVTKGKATALKGDADNLNQRITAAVEPISGFDSTVNNMADKAKEAQLKDAHVSAIVAVATIDSMLGNAATTIGQIEEKKSEVNGIFDKMQKDCTAELTQSNEVIKEQCQIANDALTAATGALENAKSAKADIQTQKGIADAALTKVTEEKQEVSEAQGEVQKAEECVAAAQLIVTQLNDLLQTADSSVTNANNSKEKLKTALSTATRATHTEQSVTNPEVKTLRGSVSAAVTEMQTLMEESVRILQETENHNKTVHDVVQEMQTLKTNAKMESNEINELCKNAEGELTKSTGAVQKVKTEKEAMRKEKVIADAALTEVNEVTEINKAQQQADTATSCLAKVKEILSQLRSALQTAESSVAKTNELKQKLKTALSTTTTVPSTKKVKEAEKSDPPEGQGTEPDQKDTTTQPTITNSEQPASKEPLTQGDNSADELKDTLINGAQNVPTTALTGEKAPAPGAKNDSAMTVSVPLLVALIASAVWQ